MPLGEILQISLLVLLFLITTFFAVSETCFISINRIKLKTMVNEDIKNAKEVLDLLNNLDKLLSTILVGYNVTSIIIPALAASIAIRRFPDNEATAIAVTTIILTVVTLVIGESIPKTLAARYSEALAVKIVVPVKIVVALLTPIAFLLRVTTKFILKIFGLHEELSDITVTEEELKSIVSLSCDEGVIEEHKADMIQNVFSFSESVASEVMTPRTDIMAVSTNDSYLEITEVFRSEQFSRLPVYDEDIDKIVGVICFKDFIFTDKDNFSLDSVMRPAFFSYENKETSGLLKQMRVASTSMAIILDEYSGTAGLVTIEDLLEEIVGDIGDEFDENEEDKIKKISDNTYIAYGVVNIDDFNEFAGTQLVSEDFNSIGGYCLGLFNDIPENGHSKEFNNIKFTVLEISKNRIEKVRIEVANPDEVS